MEDEEGSDQSFLAHLPEIVELILIRLTGKVLRVTSSVNRMWREISNSILMSRSRCRKYYFPNDVIRADEADEVLDNLPMHPKAAVFLSHRESWLTRRDPHVKRAEERNLARMVRLFAAKVPPDCFLIGCTTERILSSDRDPQTGVPVLDHKREGHSLILLPYIEGVSYHRAFIRQPKPSRGQTWADLFGVPESIPVKLVLLTALSHSRDHIPVIAAAIRRTYGPRVVVLGVVAHDRVFIDGLVKRTRVTALFISGENFRACAKFISNERDANFYERIDSLVNESNKNEFEHQLSIFITSRFISRGNAFYINSLTAFRRPFSEAPVMGLYSFGEFCLSEKDVGKTRPNTCKRFMKHNAAIFCACSFRKRSA